MSKKGDNLFERYIDKVVLGVSGLFSLWLLWIFVLGNPYAAEYDGRKLGAGEIDKYIEQQEVQQLLSKLEETPKPKIYDKMRKKFPKIEKMYACSIDDINEDVFLPIPGYAGKVSPDARLYVLPEIGEVSDVAIEHYRSVVYVPAEPVVPENPYNMALTDLGDIDLVTVEASFDTSDLYKNFEQSFSGRLVRRDWQDKNLAKPVFASVGLQRRRRLSDGSFSDWAEVGRTRVDNLKTMLDGIPEKIDDKHTINLLMVKFDEFAVRKGLLQPSTYDFAASNDDWLPPKLHKEYVKLMKEEADRQRREQQKLDRGIDRGLQTGRTGTGRMGAAGGRGARGANLGGRSRTGTLGGRGGRAGGAAGRDRRGTTGRRGSDRGRTSTRGRSDTGRYGDSQLTDQRTRQKKERKPGDVYKDFQKVLLTEKSNPSKMSGLTFWAHDDTVIPGESYQYRIRLGVFNPIAGRDWFKDKQEDYKDKPILWSGYSRVTETVKIPLMMHFFPLDVVAKEEKVVNIKVGKFHHGKWRSEDFQVRPGEMIGKVVEKKPETGNLGVAGGYEGIGGGYADTGGGYSTNGIEKIDFSTNASVVDVVQTSDWTGINRLQEREYADVLYSEDGSVISHLAVKSRNWPEDLQEQFNLIKESEKELVQIRARVSGVQSGVGLPTERPGVAPHSRDRRDMMMRRMGRYGGGMMPQRQ